MTRTDTTATLHPEALSLLYRVLRRALEVDRTHSMDALSKEAVAWVVSHGSDADRHMTVSRVTGVAGDDEPNELSCDLESKDMYWVSARQPDSATAARCRRGAKPMERDDEPDL